VDEQTRHPSLYAMRAGRSDGPGQVVFRGAGAFIFGFADPPLHSSDEIYFNAQSCRRWLSFQRQFSMSVVTPIATRNVASRRMTRSATSGRPGCKKVDRPSGYETVLALFALLTKRCDFNQVTDFP
jgi:hypothetical protein